MTVDTPDWVRDAIFYQIFPDRFAASERVHKPGTLEPWDAPPTVNGFKGGDLRLLRQPVAQRARAVVAIGEARRQVRDALDGTVPVHEAASLRDAVRQAYELAQPDGVVLLAPACASFDMFRDYAERGRMFKEEVARLKTRAT